MASDPHDDNLVYTGTDSDHALEFPPVLQFLGLGSLSMTVAGLKGGAATAPLFTQQKRTQPLTERQQRGLWNHISKKASASFSV